MLGKSVPVQRFDGLFEVLTESEENRIAEPLTPAKRRDAAGERAGDGNPVVKAEDDE